MGCCWGTFWHYARTHVLRGLGGVLSVITILVHSEDPCTFDNRKLLCINGVFVLPSSTLERKSLLVQGWPVRDSR